MKQLIVLILTTTLFVACDDSKKEKDNTTTDKKETSANTPSATDALLADWLKGKILTSDTATRDYHNFKLNADGTCEDKGGAKVSWSIEGGKLNMGGLMKIDIEKKDDNTLIMHRSLSDEVYKVSPL